jgi:molybdopterin molybdotransferase
MPVLISPHEARTLIRHHIVTNPIEDCSLLNCNGRILAQSIAADRAFPPFDRSMMDGYALCAQELAAGEALKIIGQAAAGCPQMQLPIAEKACIEIMTGAIIPQHADCVVPYESVESIDPTKIRIPEPASFAPGDYIHPQGSDLPQGSEILPAGTRIGSRQAAILATCGYDSVRVYQQAKIAIITTGDELVPVTEKPALQQIRRSNDHCIRHALAAHQIESSLPVHLGDEPQLCKNGLASQIANHSVLIISGGVSRGKKDFIPETLTELGFHCHFHGVAQKPGKPFGFWTQPGRVVFTLPGNPVSTLTCLHAYVLPALDQQMGQLPPRRQSLRLRQPIASHHRLTRFIPVRIEHSGEASAHMTQNSGDMIRILASDGFIEVPKASPEQATQSGEFDYYPWK